MVETRKKWVKMGEIGLNPNIPNVKEASKYPLSNNNNAHSITKYGVLGRLDVQIVALRLVHPLKGHRWGMGQKRCPARARRANATGGGRSNGPYADSPPLSDHFQGGGGLGLGGGRGAAKKGGHEATETGFAYAPVSQAHGHYHIVQCLACCTAA